MRKLSAARPETLRAPHDNTPSHDNPPPPTRQPSAASHPDRQATAIPPNHAAAHSRRTARAVARQPRCDLRIVADQATEPVLERTRTFRSGHSRALEIAVREYDNCMKRITVSLPDKMVEKIKRAAGGDRQVSAYVAAALEDYQERERLDEILAAWRDETPVPEEIQRQV